MIFIMICTIIAIILVIVITISVIKDMKLGQLKNFKDIPVNQGSKSKFKHNGVYYFKDKNDSAKAIDTNIDMMFPLMAQVLLWDDNISGHIHHNSHDMGGGYNTGSDGVEITPLHDHSHHQYDNLPDINHHHDSHHHTPDFGVYDTDFGGVHH